LIPTFGAADTWVVERSYYPPATLFGGRDQISPLALDRLLISGNPEVKGSTLPLAVFVNELLTEYAIG
jgi:hypothetical protein